MALHHVAAAAPPGVWIAQEESGDDVKAQASLGSAPVSFLHLFSGVVAL